MPTPKSSDLELAADGGLDLHEKVQGILAAEAKKAENQKMRRAQRAHIDAQAAESKAKGLDADANNAALVKRFRRVSVTRSFELRGVFKRLERSRVLSLRPIARPLVAARAPRGRRVVRRSRARSPGPRLADDPEPVGALAGVVPR